MTIELTASAKLRLRISTRAVALAPDKKASVLIPAGTTLIVSATPFSEDGRMVHLLWQSELVAMFAQDVIERCEVVN